MIKEWPVFQSYCKGLLPIIAIAVFFSLFVGGCAVNPATGDRQFTALMSPGQELQVGQQEHAKIVEKYGLVADKTLSSYVERIGQAVAADTERPDVHYKFFVIDSPIVNAFALPGGYIYVSRGLLAQANSEAELAGVLAHEVGHITARHSAERYSQSVLTSLGTFVLAAATESADAARMASLGSELYIKSYSRSQEHQADELGVRYLAKADYDTAAMAGFLKSLGRHSALEGQLSGRDSGRSASYFSTHPQTTDRVAQVAALAQQYTQNAPVTNRDPYFKMIDGLVYGDSLDQGFVRKDIFYHPVMGFAFAVPGSFYINNQPSKIVAVSRDVKGATFIFDAASNKEGLDPAQYLSSVWMKGEALTGLENITVNGMPAAAASFRGRIGQQNVDIRLVAIKWNASRIFRFKMAVPENAPRSLVDDLKRTTYSLRAMTAQEKSSVKPFEIDIVKAHQSDTVESMGARMPYNDFPVARFSVLNATAPQGTLVSGRSYKLIKDKTR